MTTKPSAALSSIPTAAKKRAEEKTRSAQQEAAAKAAQKLAEQRARRAQADLKVPPEDLIFYYQCPDADCNGPGIWIKGSASAKNGVPSGILDEEKWWSSYHDLGDPYPAKDIICQCCYSRPNAEGKPSKRRVPLRLYHAGGKPVLNPRWLGPKKPVRDPVSGDIQEIVACGYTPHQFEALCRGEEVNVEDPFEKAGEVNHG